MRHRKYYPHRWHIQSGYANVTLAKIIKNLTLAQLWKQVNAITRVQSRFTRCCLMIIQSRGNKDPPSHWVIVCKRLLLPYVCFHFVNVKALVPASLQRASLSSRHEKYLHYYISNTIFTLVMRFWKRAKVLKTMAKQSVKREMEKTKKKEKNVNETLSSRWVIGTAFVGAHLHLFNVPLGWRQGVFYGGQVQQSKTTKKQKKKKRFLTCFQSEVLSYSPNLTPSFGLYSAWAVLK